MTTRFNAEVAAEIAPSIATIENETMRAWSHNYLYGHFDHYNSVLKSLSPLIQNKTGIKILDIGGVPSHMDALLKKAGYDVEVVDINPDRIAGFLKAHNIVSYKVDIENQKMPIVDNSYDIVMFNEILEHLRVNPLNAFEEIKRVLKPGGTLILSTPNITPFMRWQFFRGIDYIDDVVAEYGKLKKFGHMGHFRIYSETEVRRVLDYFGFKIISGTYGGKIDRTPKSKMNWFYRTFYKDKMFKQIYFVCKNEK